MGEKMYLALLLCASAIAASAQGMPGKTYVGMRKFLSRPDLEVASWKVKVYDEEALASGYWFVAPYEKNGYRKPGGAWIGPHIYDGAGELIWSGSELFGRINVMDFGVMDVAGKEMLSMSYAVEGNGYILDNKYQVQQTVFEGITGQTYNMHDFHTVDNGNHFLYLQRNITHASRELTMKELGYDGECSITFPGFEERDVATGEILFKWDATGIIPMSDSTMNFTSVEDRCTGPSWDYLHSNAIDKLADGHYLLSTRHSDTIYKISKHDGSIIWRLHGLGGERSDFDMGNLNFSRQHDARFREYNGTHTIISFLDNAKGADPRPGTSKWTRGLLVALDESSMKASIIASYDHPHQEYSFRRGSYQVLDNKNVFMGWSEQALHSEHTPDGRLLMEAELVEHSLGTYRSFKFPFVGDPQDPPDVYSNASSNGNTTTTAVYVSWNGATEVNTWVLYKAQKDGALATSLTSLKTESRSGFETMITHDGFARYVVVEAKDKHGYSLGKSDVIETETTGEISPEAVADEDEWLGGESKTWHHVPGTPSTWLRDVAVFLGGVFCGGIILTTFLMVRKRGMRWWLYREGPSYQRVGLGDAAEYDETKLDDLPSSRGYRDRPDSRLSPKKRDSDEEDSP